VGDAALHLADGRILRIRSLVGHGTGERLLYFTDFITAE